MSLDNHLNEFGLKCFLFDRKPENLPTSEILISSLQRQLGLSSNTDEGVVYSVDNKYNIKELFKVGHLSDIDFILRRNLRSTIHSKSDLLKYSHRYYSKPFIPEISSFVHAPRATGNPWVPGRYILEELYLGAKSDEEYIEFIELLKAGFGVDIHSDNEDILAKFMQNSLNVNTILDDTSFDIKSLRTLKKKFILNGHLRIHEFMFENFKYIIKLKDKMTRYRWLNFIEGYLKFFLYMTSLYRLSLPVYCKNSLINKESKLNTSQTFLKYGDSRQDINKNILLNYVKSILFITEIIPRDSDYEHIDDLYERLSDINFIEDDVKLKVIKQLQNKFKEDYELRNLKNIKEFIDYIGIQRKDSSKMVADNTYFFKLHGKSYIFDFGKSLLFLLINLCGMHIRRNTFSSSDFINYLQQFGLFIDEKFFGDEVFLKRLKDLGVLLEMSDSESGLLLKSFWYEFE